MSTDITIHKGLGYEMGVTYNDPSGNPIDITGYTAKMQIRINRNDSTPVVDISSPDEITIGGSDGTLSISIPTAETNVNAESGVYDIVITSPGGEKTLIAEGDVTFKRPVTRD